MDDLGLRSLVYLFQPRIDGDFEELSMFGRLKHD